jgi:transcriptional regulator with XRE-family HTH domain
MGLSQVEICRRTGITPPTWNNYEKGLHRVSIEAAREIRKVTRADLDFIYLGDKANLPYDLVEAIQKIEEEEAAARTTAAKKRRRA